MAAADMTNNRAHRKGITPEEMAECYSKWAESMKYDKDLDGGIYNGPSIITEEMCECFPEGRDRLKIMDMACGTGRVGSALSPRGFTCIDGVDPSSGMLKQCRNLNLYKQLYEEYCCDKMLPIEDNVYDCLVIAGGMGEGHIPCSGLYEMIRIVKPGGLILIVMRKEYLNYVEEYMDRLEPLMARLERESCIEVVERREVANYSFGRQGVLFKLTVKEGKNIAVAREGMIGCPEKTA